MNKLYTTLFASLAACCILTTVHADVNNAQQKTAPAQPAQTAQQVKLEKYTNAETGYSLDYPSDWTKNDVPQLDLVLFAPFKESNDKPLASMNIISEKVGSGITLDQFYTQSAANLSTALKDVVVEKKGTSMLNGTPTQWMQYTHVMQGVKFTVIQYFIVSNETIYLMTFSSAADDFEKYRPDFERIANSFKLQVQPAQAVPQAVPAVNTQPTIKRLGQPEQAAPAPAK